MFFYFYFFINTFVQEGCIKMMKNDIKCMYNVKNIYNKCCSLELVIHQRIMVFTKILRSKPLFNIDNNKKCYMCSKSSYVTWVTKPVTSCTGGNSLKYIIYFFIYAKNHQDSNQ